MVLLDDVMAEVDARLARGLLDAETLVPYLHRAFMDPECGSHLVATDNELLGITPKTEEDILVVLRKLPK
jgi:hypothetical protein